METIGVFGFYGKHNTGDESYKLSFPMLFPGYNFVFTDIYNPNIKTWILGGGDVICEENLNALSQAKKKYIFSATLANTYDYGKISNYQVVGLRDNESISNAKASGLYPVYMPDFAFKLKGNKQNGLSLIKDAFNDAGADLYSRVITVVVNSHLMPNYNNGGKISDFLTFHNFVKEFTKTIDMTSASFLFVPFGKQSPWDDRVSNGVIVSNCKYNKNCSIDKRLSVQDTLDILCASDIVISTRLHSSIFCCANGIPFLDITHNHKNRSFLHTIEMEKLAINIFDASSDNINKKINWLIGNNQIREELNLISKKQGVLLDNFSKIIKL